MSNNLVIVESPAKAKTIGGFLGKDFQIKSCFGHIRDLTKSAGGIDIKNNFTPTYIIPEEKKKVVDELKKIAKKAKIVWLATDEDREGEAISWHLTEALELEEKKTKRIVFHEITKNAILDAVQNPRSLNINLVNAQQARRVLDRLVGFELSPLLWKKVRPSLSAGRVQSVAVRLIVEREREITKFQPKNFFRISALFNLPPLKDEDPPIILKAESPTKFENNILAEQFLNSCKGTTFNIKNLETKPSKKSPSPPFTTSTLQQEASRKLGFSVARTMLIAQRLYESGKITYMRTDSVNLSNTALDAAKQEIISTYGKQYSNSRNFKTKTKGAQEAHEAIRPTYFNQHSVGGEASEQRLYDLIWKRAIASQMSDANIEKTIATIGNTNNNALLFANGEVLKFDGFLKVYMESFDDDEQDIKEGKDSGKILPPLQVGQILNLNQLIATERFTGPSARYTEASLVKKMEELGIGRPSTYAPTISTIQKRGYVVKEDRGGVERNYLILTLKDNQIETVTKTEITGTEKSKLFPTDIGMLVNDFLVQHFSDILNYSFTADIEKEFDEIAQGEKVWNEMINKFYGPFHKNVELTLKNSVRVTGEKLLGLDPESGKNVYVRVGRYGPLVQIGESNTEEKPKFASLRSGQSIESIDLIEALKLFGLPRKIGIFEDKEIIAAIGRFGPYLKHDAKFYSLKKEDDPLTVTNERALIVIEEKRKADKEKVIKIFSENKEVKILKGRWGPYISMGSRNIKIPKDKKPELLTLEECIQLSKDAPVSRKAFPKKYKAKNTKE